MAATAVVKQPVRPFYDNGPNDKGMGCSWAIRWAAWRWAFCWRCAGGHSAGFCDRHEPAAYRALDPFIQVLKPISPLAWMPLALYTIKELGRSAASS
jgi:nitrate/nitrite transport system permease protein